MPKWLTFALLGIAALGTPDALFAQAGFAVGPRFAPPRFASNLTISFHANPSGFARHPILFPENFYSYPFLYPDYFTPSPAVQAPAPTTQVIVIQPAENRREDDKPIQLLVFERRGDHFVRISDLQPELAPRLKTAEENSRGTHHPSFTAQSLRHHPPPTVLVFRDGRRQETSSYTIIGNILYTASDYWSTGAWTNSVDLAALDLPATMRENHARGVKFNLPTGPHEVVVRP
jgi:hypothetical protein